MSDMTSRWFIVPLCLCGVLMGCKGSSSSVARRKDPHVSAQSKEPSRGAVNRSNRREVPALSSPQNAAYYSEQREGAYAASSRPQHTCPIDGNALGQSGAPLTVTLKGEPVFVCCQSCANKAQKDPDKYLARVRAETAETTR
jgi:hypothetical protein